ncbi:hypothetical protein [Streptomyces griseoaurantiacus]|uniref:hypothetical protein n=1 Tax=Streptomyces griseoaurantiacus TaxID=68213 RepID=UPI0036BB4E57
MPSGPRTAWHAYRLSEAAEWPRARCHVAVGSADTCRISAQITRSDSPCPPGVPVVAPGEVITREVVDYLTSGVAAGMLIPDAADPTARTFRVTATR